MACISIVSKMGYQSDGKRQLLKMEGKELLYPVFLFISGFSV